MALPFIVPLMLPFPELTWNTNFQRQQLLRQELPYALLLHPSCFWKEVSNHIAPLDKHASAAGIKHKCHWKGGAEGNRVSAMPGTGQYGVPAGCWHLHKPDSFSIRGIISKGRMLIP